MCLIMSFLSAILKPVFTSYFYYLFMISMIKKYLISKDILINKYHHLSYTNNSFPGTLNLWFCLRVLLKFLHFHYWNLKVGFQTKGWFGVKFPFQRDFQESSKDYVYFQTTFTTKKNKTKKFKETFFPPISISLNRSEFSSIIYIYKKDHLQA